MPTSALKFKHPHRAVPYEYLSSKASPIHISEFKLSHSLTLGELSLSLSLRERWVTQKTMQLVSHSQQYADLWSLSWATKSTGIDRGLESCCTTSQTEKLCWPLWKPTSFSQVWCEGHTTSGSHDSMLLSSLAVSSITESRPRFLRAAPARDRAWRVHEALPVRRELLHQATLTGGSAVPRDTAGNYWNSTSKIYCFLTSRNIELYWKDKSLENNM